VQSGHLFFLEPTSGVWFGLRRLIHLVLTQMLQHHQRHPVHDQDLRVNRALAGHRFSTPLFHQRWHSGQKCGASAAWSPMQVWV
jgi:hypothetical protein